MLVAFVSLAGAVLLPASGVPVTAEPFTVRIASASVLMAESVSSFTAMFKVIFIVFSSVVACGFFVFFRVFLPGETNYMIIRIFLLIIFCVLIWYVTDVL